MSNSYLLIVLKMAEKVLVIFFSFPLSSTILVTLAGEITVTARPDTVEEENIISCRQQTLNKYHQIYTL